MVNSVLMDLARARSRDLAALQKTAVAPPASATDPAMGGAPPMDPTMAGGAGMPMDPAMAGGAGGMPPMDPAMGGMDPSAAGTAPAPPMSGIDPAVMSQIAAQIVPQVVAQLGGQAPAAGPAGNVGPAGGPKGAKKPDIGAIADDVRRILAGVTAMMNGMGVQIPTEMVTGVMPGGPSPVAGAGDPAAGAAPIDPAAAQAAAPPPPESAIAPISPAFVEGQKMAESHANPDVIGAMFQSLIARARRAHAR